MSDPEHEFDPKRRVFDGRVHEVSLAVAALNHARARPQGMSSAGGVLRPLAPAQVLEVCPDSEYFDGRTCGLLLAAL